MKISVDISLYPLKEKFTKPIDAFIKGLYKYPGLKVRTHHLSTMVIGEYDEVMEALNKEVFSTFSKEVQACFVMKILKGDAEKEVDIEDYQ